MKRRRRATPHGIVTTSGTGAFRTFSFLTGQDATSPTTVTLTVQDPSGATGTADVAVTVTPVNDPPSFVPIAAQAVQEDQTSEISFTITDPDGASSAYVYGRGSDNNSLLDTAGITVSGDNMGGRITMTPKLNQAGTAVVTISASDGTVVGTTMFNVTVFSVDDPPIISPPMDVTLPLNVASTLSFSVSDVDSSTDPLTFSATASNAALFPPGSLVLGGSGADRTITLTPAAGQAGDADVTLSVVGIATTAQFHVEVRAGGSSSGMAGSSNGGTSGAGSSGTMASGSSSGVITTSSDMTTSGGASAGGGNDGGDKGGCNSLTASNTSTPFAAILLGLLALAARRRRR